MLYRRTLTDDALRLAVLVALTGCFPQFGTYEAGGGNDAAGGQGGAFVPVACGESRVCVEVPPGWQGPVSLRAPDEPCDSRYPTMALTGKANPSGTPATCECGCEPVAGGGCGQAHFRAWGSASCAADPWTTFDMQPGCVNASAGSPLSIDQPAPPTVTPGACQATSTKTVDPPTYEVRAACGDPIIEGDCESGACTPIPDGAAPRVCVFAPGDVAVCPGGAFTDKIVLFDDVDDGRACSCSCGVPDGSCSATIGVFSTSDCGFSVGQTTGPCVGITLGRSQFIRSLYADIDYTPGTCPASGGPAGEVAGVGPTTVCCTPPL